MMLFTLISSEEYHQLQYAHETALSEKGMALHNYQEAMERLQALQRKKEVTFFYKLIMAWYSFFCMIKEVDQELWQTCQKLERTELQLVAVEEAVLERTLKWKD